MSKEFLHQLPLFSGLSDEDIDHLYRMAEPVELQAGQVLMEEGDPGDSLYIAMEGQFEISKRSGERDVVIAGCGAGDVIGEMSLLEGSPRTATVRAAGDARLVKISRETFTQLLERSPSASLSMLRTVTARLRNTEAMLRQSEKMAALGTLSAGLAHELNNPAAALKRSASQMHESLAELQRLAARLASPAPTPEAMEIVNGLRQDLPRRASKPVKLNPLERSDLESEIASWMEDQGVEEPWELASPLVSLGWKVPDLQEMASAFSPDQRPVFLRWIATASTVYALIGEVGEGAERISELVKAVKSYAYLDQGPVQLVDIHDGLESTLVILRHKLKYGVSVVKEYAPDLPRVEAYASVLNQVWTNLIDNAIDAMSGKGELRIRTFAEGTDVIVEITDNGPGIPAEIRDRVFDAFFTTKPVGAGTGLGLYITYNAVVHQHHGRIVVASEPGRTTFRVIIPVQLEKKP
jgi:signal transduction histidine kinase